MLRGPGGLILMLQLTQYMGVHRHISHRGFTIIELLVVIAIIGILSAVILVSISSAREKAKIASARSQLSQIKGAIRLLENDTGEWPSHLPPGYILECWEGSACYEELNLNAGTAGLVTTDGTYPRWGGPYMQSVPLDPWGHPYWFSSGYDTDPSGVQVWSVMIGSNGPNGVAPHPLSFGGSMVVDSDDIYMTLQQQ